MSRSKVSRPCVTILTVSPWLTVQCQSSQNTNKYLHLLVPGMGELICLTKISLRLELPAVELTFLRWTEILFYVTVAKPSGELPWEKQHLSPFYRKNSKQSCCLAFPNGEFCHVVLRREEGNTFRCLNSINGEWCRDTVVCNIGNNLPRFSLSTKPTAAGLTPDLLSW